MGWQPIETAPRDGSWIVLLGEFAGGDTLTADIARYAPVFENGTTYEWQAVSGWIAGIDEDYPLHELWNWLAEGRALYWMPLPPPPATGEAG